METLVCHTCRNVEVDIFAGRKGNFSPWLTFERFENRDRREDWTLIICLTFIWNILDTTILLNMQ